MARFEGGETGRWKITVEWSEVNAETPRRRDAKGAVPLALIAGPRAPSFTTKHCLKQGRSVLVDSRRQIEVAFPRLNKNGYPVFLPLRLCALASLR